MRGRKFSPFEIIKFSFRFYLISDKSCLLLNTKNYDHETLIFHYFKHAFLICIESNQYIIEECAALDIICHNR